MSADHSADINSARRSTDLVVAAADPDPLRSPSSRNPLPTTGVVVAVTAPPWPAHEENASVAMHEVAVMKAVPIAGTTVPGCHTATVPRGHVPGPCAHPGAACNCRTAAATPATSHVTSATASMTVSHGERGYQYNRERNQESAHLTLPCLVSDKKKSA